MRNEQTLEKLKAMRLSGMADLYEQQAIVNARLDSAVIAR